MGRLVPRDARAEGPVPGRPATGWRFVAVAAPVVVAALLGLAEIGASHSETLAARAAAAHLDAVRAGAEAAATAEWTRLEDGLQRLAADGQMAQALLDLAQATRASEGDPRIEGRHMSVVVVPGKTKAPAKEVRGEGQQPKQPKAEAQPAKPEAPSEAKQ